MMLPEDLCEKGLVTRNHVKPIRRGNIIRQARLILILLLLFWTIWTTIKQSAIFTDEGSFKWFMSKQFSLSRDEANLPYVYDGDYRTFSLNRTLGFERILVLNLPSRPDRRDAMTLMAHASNLEVDFFRASNGQEVMQEEKLPTIDLLPYVTQHQSELTPGQLACYRSNLHLMQHIVKNRIQSALILQDDADWDVDLRGSLGQLQGPFYTLLERLYTKGEVPKQSYKDPWKTGAWDIFWIGANYERPWPDPGSAPYVQYLDKNVANENFAEPGGAKLYSAYKLHRNMSASDERQRIVQLSRRPLGMAAYAITLNGASKILARGNQVIRQSYDNTVCSMSRPNTLQGYNGLGCEIANPVKPLGQSELRSFSVWPPLIAQFRDSNGQRDSDLVGLRPSTFRTNGISGYSLEIKDSLRERIMSQRWSWL